MIDGVELNASKGDNYKIRCNATTRANNRRLRERFHNILRMHRFLPKHVSLFRTLGGRNFFLYRVSQPLLLMMKIREETKIELIKD